MLTTLLICTFDSLTDNFPTRAELSWPADFSEWKETSRKEDAARLEAKLRTRLKEADAKMPVASTTYKPRSGRL